MPKRLSLIIIKLFKSGGIYAGKLSLLGGLYALYYTSKSPFLFKLIPFTL